MPHIVLVRVSMQQPALLFSPPKKMPSSPELGSSEGKVRRPKSSVDSVPSSAPDAISRSHLPEGGIEAWCTVFGAFLAQFCTFGYTSAFGVYQAFYARDYLQNESASAISWIGSLVTFLLTALGPISGPLFDNGYFYHVYITGAVLVSLSIFVLSLVQPGKYYQILLVQGFTSGLGQGLMYIPSFAIISHHFKRRQTAMLSIVASGASLGGIAHTIMLNKLLNSPLGFKTSVRISAAFITALLFLSCALATKKCFTEIPSLLTIIGFTFFQVALLYPFFYFQVDSLRHGLSASFAFYSLVIVNAGSFVGRFMAGALLPFFGVIDLTIITTITCAILTIGMIWLGSVASVVVLGILYGLFAGTNVAMMAPMFGLTSDHADLGVRMGMGFAISGIGGLVGSPVCGALLTSSYRWWAPALFCGVIALASGVLFVCVRFLFMRGQACASAARLCASDEGKVGNESGTKDRAPICP